MPLVGIWCLYKVVQKYQAEPLPYAPANASASDFLVFSYSWSVPYGGQCLDIVLFQLYEITNNMS